MPQMLPYLSSELLVMAVLVNAVADESSLTFMLAETSSVTSAEAGSTSGGSRSPRTRRGRRIETLARAAVGAQ